MNVAGKKVLLTGATGGIGHAIARRIAAEGGVLTLTGRRKEVLEPLAAELGAEVHAADLADADQLEALLGAAAATDILIANAALPGSGRLVSLTALEVDRALAVNLRAPIRAAQVLAPLMAGRGGGHLVFISSIAGKAATPGTSIYNATKFGLRGFSLAMRAELRSQKVGVSTIFPGFIRDAGMFADANIDLPPGVGTRTPEEVADAVLLAIVKNKAEVDVAPASIRYGAAFAGLAPEFSAHFTRLVGGEKIALKFEANQSDKR